MVEQLGYEGNLRVVGPPPGEQVFEVDDAGGVVGKQRKRRSAVTPVHLHIYIIHTLIGLEHKRAHRHISSCL